MTKNTQEQRILSVKNETDKSVICEKMFLLFDWVKVTLGKMLHLFNCWNYNLDLPGLSTNKQVPIIPVGASCDSSCGNADLRWTENETQKHLHVSSEPVQVVVGLFTFNDAVVF